MARDRRCREPLHGKITLRLSVWRGKLSRLVNIRLLRPHSGRRRHHSTGTRVDGTRMWTLLIGISLRRHNRSWLWRFGNRGQEVSFAVVSWLRWVFGVLCSRLCRIPAKIIPYLVLFGEVDLDLGLVGDWLKLEFCPGVTLDKGIILSRLVVVGTLGLQLVLCLSRGRHGNSVG